MLKVGPKIVVYSMAEMVTTKLNGIIIQGIFLISVVLIMVIQLDFQYINIINKIKQSNFLLQEQLNHSHFNY